MQIIKDRFKKGSGVYECRCCKHNTRDTGGDGSSVQLCDICYELAGYQNAIMNKEELSIQDRYTVVCLLLDLSIRNKEQGLEVWDELYSAVKD